MRKAIITPHMSILLPVGARTVNIRYFRFLLICLAFSMAGLSFAQEHIPDNTGNVLLRKGIDLYQSGQYAQARTYFAKVYTGGKQQNSLQAAQAAYLEAMCAIRLFHNDAVPLSEKFIRQYPESPYANRLLFELGQFFYADKKYGRAVLWYDRVKESSLSADEQAERHFKMGYAAFQEGDTAKAKTAFFEVIDIPSAYFAPANYYYAHIHYAEGNLLTALESFRELESDETFGAIVPYYIIQILYKLERYDEVIALGPGLIQNVTEKREAEVARIIGEAFYHNGQLDSATIYMDRFYDHAEVKSNDDIYLYAYIYYQKKDYEKAAGIFEEIADPATSLGQNAAFHLADCYMQTNNLEKSRMAFYAASKAEHDKHLAEEAFYHYAMLNHRLSVNAFNEVINTFNQFLKRYPNSTHVQEIQQSLVAAYVNTNNYKGAYQAMQEINIQSPELKQAYQKVAFHRGVELYQAGDYPQAIELFEISGTTHPFNTKLTALSVYWTAEAHYQLGDYSLANQKYQDFIKSMGAFQLPEYSRAHYNLGYTFFKQKQYAQANSWFRKYENLALPQDSLMLIDAYNRMGDCYFSENKYWPALDYYAKSDNKGLVNADYVRYQLGFTYGLVDRNIQKIDILESLLVEYPRSVYYDDALYELGRSYVENNQIEKAEAKYLALIEKYPDNLLSAKAQVNLGLLYFNKNRFTDARDMYQRTVVKFPGTQEARNALIGLKNVYLETDEVDQYVEFVEDLDQPVKIEVAEQDSLTFAAAENIYLKDNCDKAVSSLRNYLTRFQDGNYRVQASFYMGDCLYRNEKYNKAQLALEEVVEAPLNEFSEQALLAMCRMLYKQRKHSEVVPYYHKLEKMASTDGNRLEAQLGLVNSYFALNEYKELTEAAERALATPKLSEPIQFNVRFKYGKALFELERYDEALQEFRYCADNLKTEEGAESKYRIAQIFYRQDKWPKAEQVIYDYVDKSTPHQYWLAKSFLLLARIFMDTGDEFQANHTLNSVIDNYENREDGIYTEAWDMKREIKAMKEARENKAQEPVEIQMTE